MAVAKITAGEVHAAVHNAPQSGEWRKKVKEHWKRENGVWVLHVQTYWVRAA